MPELHSRNELTHKNSLGTGQHSATPLMITVKPLIGDGTQFYAIVSNRETQPKQDSNNKSKKELIKILIDTTL